MANRYSKWMHIVVWGKMHSSSALRSLCLSRASRFRPRTSFACLTLHAFLTADRRKTASILIVVHSEYLLIVQKYKHFSRWRSDNTAVLIPLRKGGKHTSAGCTKRYWDNRREEIKINGLKPLWRKLSEESIWGIGKRLLDAVGEMGGVR